MTVNKFFKNVSVGTAALTLVLTLAGCGNSQSASSTKRSSANSSTQSSENDSTKAVCSANRSIRNNNFQAAYDNLNNTNNRSNEANNLKDDLQNYLTAKRAYDNGDYQTASNNLKPLKSTSTAMRIRRFNLRLTRSKMLRPQQVPLLVSGSQINKHLLRRVIVLSKPLQIRWASQAKRAIQLSQHLLTGMFIS